MSQAGPIKNVYESNYITNVIFRVDFPKILELNEQKTPIKFQEAVSERFPKLEEIKGGVLDVKIEKDMDISLKHENKVTWEFSNKEKTKKVFINSDFVSIEYLKYEHFADFLNEIQFVFDTFTSLYPVKISKRIGLRYINQIKLDSGDPMDWNNLIHPSLFSNYNEFKLENIDILRSMRLLELKEGEYRLKFQFGLSNSEYPNPIARKEFILDYDCSTNEELEISEIFNLAKEFNIIIYRWFENSILEDLREKMGVVKK
ncbi:MAG: TIGR04255 family protein [Thermotogota bacterium]|nr:TIGR04255 family protein [Thermotogota bacterium]